jgi:thiamine-monophosphate kinase
MKPETTPFPSEDAWTAHLAASLARRDDVRTGIGDDAAVVQSPGTAFDLVYTTDAVVESIHFFSGTEPRKIGRKMVGRLLSDLAAMGAEPDHILINLVCPKTTPALVLKQIYAGAEALAVQFGARVIGGDTLSSSPLALHGFASGRLPAGSAVLRSGAQPGDAVYVTGKLGGSLAGRHLDFVPRVTEGIWLRSGGWPTAMMDVSDGLARDLRRIADRSGVGMHIIAENLPRHDGIDVLHALTDGEDYELLFTVDAAKTNSFESAWRTTFTLSCTRIGQITPATDGLVVVDSNGHTRPLDADGYDHMV